MIYLPHHFITQLFLLSLLGGTAAQRCVYPDGSASPDTPCISYTTNSNFSSCCGARDYCLDNGLCISTSTLTYWRGSCTHVDWSGCNDLCNALIPNGSGALQLCENGLHCCSSASNDFSCCNRTAFVNVPYNFVVLPRGEQLQNAGLVTSGTTVTATATISTANCTSTAGGQSDTCTGEGSKKVMIAVGAVLGSLLAVALAVIGWQYWRMEKLKGYGDLLARPTAGGIEDVSWRTRNNSNRE
ncbi:hypothetical protein TWF694_005010 [Orbilia ellipsospora]|uniref:Mid2 domain-containing protein n=1 Tax=Orbilia ellipsospora TaxID=2528407 RepID=A0AAV9X0E4_9PEZI